MPYMPVTLPDPTSVLPPRKSDQTSGVSYWFESKYVTAMLQRRDPERELLFWYLQVVETGSAANFPRNGRRSRRHLLRVPNII